MGTPHINAKKHNISNLVILSGDPIRVKYIAETFLKNAIQINNIRNMFGYTGKYKNILVSVMSHGMGIPSAAIYVTELIKFYDIKKMIRVGTCGTIQKNIFLKDIIIALGASTDSNFNRIRFKNYDFAAIADFHLIYKAFNIAGNRKINIHIGNFFTTDIFYTDDKEIVNILKKYNILAIDMETAGIYNIAAEYRIPVMSICSVSDHILLKNQLSTKERECSFNDMIEIALETIIS
ncbi:purine-nucleoside phosphorylase [Buchnera aphidicola]|uniref:purine-nucleoside phosphorylase n=1 Tax=Buchnera aphidicola TaxID=9 RepID=UPI0034649558